MSANISNRDERSVAFIRVILIYIILLLCALIPVYYLLDLPEKWKEGTGIKGEIKIKENVQLERYLVKVDSIQKYLDKSNLGFDYLSWGARLSEFSKDSVNDNAYKPLFVKIAGLYEAIRQFKEYAEYKLWYEEMKKDKISLEEKLKKAEEKLAECKAKLDE